MNNDDAIDLLVSMAPEESKMEVARLLKKHEDFNNEDDPVYQIMLQLAIYQKFQSRYPGELKEVAIHVENCRNTILGAAEIMAKIERSTNRSYIVHGIFLLIMLLFVVYYSASLDNKFIELEKHRMEIQKEAETKTEDPIDKEIKEMKDWIRDVERRSNY